MRVAAGHDDGARDPHARAAAFIKTTCALAEAALRSAYVRSVLLGGETSAIAAMLDVVCARAEQAEELAREALVAVVDAVNDASCAAAVQLLREEAAAGQLLALERLVRRSSVTGAPRDDAGRPRREVPDPDDDHIPDYGRGRPLTLGERKSLARRPDRAMMDRLLRDPHPDVIRMVLANPKVVEEDVLAVAARRPCRPDVLTELARSRWSHRPRVRVALVLNPDTPLEVVAPIVGLLVRHELRLVATSPTVAPAVRALCLEHLDRRPPTPTGHGGGGSLQ